jgi:hypothetical protein
MRQSSQTKGRTAQPQRPVLQAVTFICSACETPEQSPTPELPKNWATETIGDVTSAYCPDCAIDLPKGQIQ